MRRSSSRSGAIPLLPLDDCLYALQATIPHLTRSSLHRCLQRHGISRLPEKSKATRPPKKKFKSYAIGFFHVDIAEVRTKEGKLHLFVGIDRTSKLAFVQLHMSRPIAARLSAFLEALIAATPYRLHTNSHRQRDPIRRLVARQIWMGMQRQSGWPFWRSRRGDDCRGATITQALFCRGMV